LVVNTHHLIIGADPMGLSAARQLELKGCRALALYFWWNFVKLHKARKLTPAPRRAGEARQSVRRSSLNSLKKLKFYLS
jgi:hypothetical protein